MRSLSGRPFSTRTVGTPSTHFSSQGDRCFQSESPMSSAISVVMTRKPLVIDGSSPSIAFWVASLMISNRMKSKLVIDASVRRPEIRTSTRRKPYTAAARNTEPTASLSAPGSRSIETRLRVDELGEGQPRAAIRPRSPVSGPICSGLSRNVTRTGSPGPVTRNA